MPVRLGFVHLFLFFAERAFGSKEIKPVSGCDVQWRKKQRINLEKKDLFPSRL